jgi:hypothetical protein
MTYWRPSFAERVERAARMWEAGAEAVREATARGQAKVYAPLGYSRAERASWALGAAHQRRDTIQIRGGDRGDYSDSLSAEKARKHRLTPAFAAWKAKRTDPLADGTR